MQNKLNESLHIVEKDLKRYKNNRDDVILSSIKKRLDKSVLTYKQDMERRISIDSVELPKDIPKKGRIIVH